MIDVGKGMKPCVCGGTYPRDLQLSCYTHPEVQGYRGECFKCYSHLSGELDNNPEDALVRWNNKLRFKDDGIFPIP